MAQIAKIVTFEHLPHAGANWRDEIHIAVSVTLDKDSLTLTTLTGRVRYFEPVRDVFITDLPTNVERLR